MTATDRSRAGGPIRRSTAALMIGFTAFAVLAPASAASAVPTSRDGVASSAAASLDANLRSAPDLGTLTVSPVGGVVTSGALEVSTGAGTACPSAATETVGYLVGPTPAWADPAKPVVAFPLAALVTGAAVSRTASGSLLELASASGLALAVGRYQAILQCQAPASSVPLGQFSGSIWVSADGRWQNTEPAGATATPAPVASAPTATAASVAPPATTSAAPTTITTPTTGTAASASATAAPTGTTTAGTSSTSVPFSATSGTSSASASASVTSPSPAPVSLRLLATTTPLGTLTLTATEGSLGAKSSFKLTLETGKSCPDGTVVLQPALIGPTSDWQQLADLSFGDRFDVDRADVAQTGYVSQFAATHSLTVVAGKYTVALVCYADGDDLTSSLGQFEGNLWFTDADHWQLTDPETSQTETVTTMVSDPVARVELGKAAKLTATVTPSTAAGAVQFQTLDSSGGLVDFPPKANDTDPSTAVPLTAGVATYSSSNLAVGLYPFKATFVPTNAAKYKGSTSSVPVYLAVVPPVPPTPTGDASISGTASSGSTLTCSGSFSGATETSWAWIRDYDTPIDATTSTYQLTDDDKGHTVRCRALATNAGGTIGRTSRAVQVAS